MSEIFQIKILDTKSEQLIALKNGAMNNRVRAQALQKFEIQAIATGKAPKKVLTQRVGDDLTVKIVSDIDGEEFDLVIEDFHSANASLWGGNDAGVLQQYQITGNTQFSPLALGEGVGSAVFASSFSSTVLAGAGVLGVAAGLAHGHPRNAARDARRSAERGLINMLQVAVTGAQPGKGR